MNGIFWPQMPTNERQIMPTILNIGHQKFLMKSPAAAAAVITAMASAVRLEWSYRDDRYLFWPHDTTTSVGLEQISVSQLRRSDPKNDVRVCSRPELGEGKI